MGQPTRSNQSIISKESPIDHMRIESPNVSEESPEQKTSLYFSNVL